MDKTAPLDDKQMAVMNEFLDLGAKNKATMTDTPETMREEIERLRLAVDRAAEVLSEGELIAPTRHVCTIPAPASTIGGNG